MKKIGKAVLAAGMSLALVAGGVTASAAQIGPEAGGPRGVNRFQQMDGRMVIREAGEYTLSGDMRGRVLVDPGQGDVKLILDGARLDGGKLPAITAISGDRLSIELADGSRNRIEGGEQGGFNGAVYSQVPLEVEGNGQLDMWSNGNFFAGSGARGFHPGENIQMIEGQFPGTPAQMGDPAQNNQQPAMPGNEQCGGQQNNQQPAMPGQQSGNQQNIQPGQQALGGQNTQQPNMPGNEQFGNQQGNPFGGMQNGEAQSSTNTAGEIVTGITENSAMALEADSENATTVTLTEENGTVKITESGTYVVTGSSSDGGITVKKGTTGVVLILEDLDLTSTSGAALSINKNAEVQVIISGDVTLTDNENPEDENSADADVADAYDGAAIKIKADSVVFITGDGTLTVNGNAKNGIKAGDDSSLIIGGDVTVDINAVNDGINGNYDVTILSGDVTISAGDDGIHADHILTVGEDGEGPDLTVTKSNEGLEGTVVNIAGGTVNVTASDDGINAANGDGAYEGELDYSINITGGDVTVKAGTDGLDSNGNVNLVGGSASIRSANNGGDAGIDYDGDLYISDKFDLNNQSGVAGPDNMMGGAPGQQQMGGQQFGGQQQMNGMPGNSQNGSQQNGGMPGGMGGQNNGGFGGMNGGFRFGR